MQQKRRKFQRPPAQKPRRKLFIIATEGKKTEPEYFHRFNSQEYPVQVKCLTKNDQSDPRHVLKRMKKHLNTSKSKGPLEAWLVIDKDRYKDEVIDELFAWASTKKNCHLAVSNPNFEYWLLLHFVNSPLRNFEGNMKKYFPNYDKGIDHSKISDTNIKQAISRARQKDRPSSNWPRSQGTTVYKLVEQILKASESS